MPCDRVYTMQVSLPWEQFVQSARSLSATDKRWLVQGDRVWFGGVEYVCGEGGRTVARYRLQSAEATAREGMRAAIAATIARQAQRYGWRVKQEGGQLRLTR